MKFDFKLLLLVLSVQIVLIPYAFSGPCAPQDTVCEEKVEKMSEENLIAYINRFSFHPLEALGYKADNPLFQRSQYASEEIFDKAYDTLINSSFEIQKKALNDFLKLSSGLQRERLLETLVQLEEAHLILNNMRGVGIRHQRRTNRFLSYNPMEILGIRTEVKKDESGKIIQDIDSRLKGIPPKTARYYEVLAVIAEDQFKMINGLHEGHENIQSKLSSALTQLQLLAEDPKRIQQGGKDYVTSNPDLYERLKVSPSATDHEIEVRVRYLQSLWGSSSRISALIIEAGQTLLNPDRRLEYNQTREDIPAIQKGILKAIHNKEGKIVGYEPLIQPENKVQQFVKSTKWTPMGSGRTGKLMSHGPGQFGFMGGMLAQTAMLAYISNDPAMKAAFWDSLSDWRTWGTLASFSVFAQMFSKGTISLSKFAHAEGDSYFQKQIRNGTLLGGLSKNIATNPNPRFLNFLGMGFASVLNHYVTSAVYSTEWTNFWDDLKELNYWETEDQKARWKQWGSLALAQEVIKKDISKLNWEENFTVSQSDKSFNELKKRYPTLKSKEELDQMLMLKADQYLENETNLNTFRAEYWDSLSDVGEEVASHFPGKWEELGTSAARVMLSSFLVEKIDSVISWAWKKGVNTPGRITYVFKKFGVEISNKEVTNLSQKLISAFKTAGSSTFAKMPEDAATKEIFRNFFTKQVLNRVKNLSPNSFQFALELNAKIQPKLKSTMGLLFSENRGLELSMDLKEVSLTSKKLLRTKKLINFSGLFAKGFFKSALQAFQFLTVDMLLEQAMYYNWNAGKLNKDALNALRGNKGYSSIDLKDKTKIRTGTIDNLPLLATYYINKGGEENLRRMKGPLKEYSRVFNEYTEMYIMRPYREHMANWEMQLTELNSKITKSKHYLEWISRGGQLQDPMFVTGSEKSKNELEEMMKEKMKSEYGPSPTLSQSEESGKEDKWIYDEFDPSIVTSQFMDGEKWHPSLEDSYSKFIDDLTLVRETARKIYPQYDLFSIGGDGIRSWDEMYNKPIINSVFYSTLRRQVSQVLGACSGFDIKCWVYYKYLNPNNQLGINTTDIGLAFLMTDPNGKVLVNPQTQKPIEMSQAEIATLIMSVVQVGEQEFNIKHAEMKKHMKERTEKAYNSQVRDLIRWRTDLPYNKRDALIAEALMLLTEVRNNEFFINLLQSDLAKDNLFKAYLNPNLIDMTDTKNPFHKFEDGFNLLQQKLKWHDSMIVKGKAEELKSPEMKAQRLEMVTAVILSRIHWLSKTYQNIDNEISLNIYDPQTKTQKTENSVNPGEFEPEFYDKEIEKLIDMKLHPERFTSLEQDNAKKKIEEQNKRYCDGGRACAN